MQWIKKQLNKAVPVADRMIKWCVRAAFELLKLTALAFMVLQVIAATLFVEVAIAAIVVFAAAYIPRKSR